MHNNKTQETNNFDYIQKFYSKIFGRIYRLNFHTQFVFSSQNPEEIHIFPFKILR